LTVLSPWP